MRPPRIVGPQLALPAASVVSIVSACISTAFEGSPRRREESPGAKAGRGARPTARTLPHGRLHGRKARLYCKNTAGLTSINARRGQFRPLRRSARIADSALRIFKLVNRRSSEFNHETHETHKRK